MHPNYNKYLKSKKKMESNLLKTCSLLNSGRGCCFFLLLGLNPLGLFIGVHGGGNGGSRQERHEQGRRAETSPAVRAVLLEAGRRAAHGDGAAGRGRGRPRAGAARGDESWRETAGPRAGTAGRRSETGQRGGVEDGHERGGVEDGLGRKVRSRGGVGANVRCVVVFAFSLDASWLTISCFFVRSNRAGSMDPPLWSSRS